VKTLEDRVAVVTGGASGVGLGIATVLHAEGARVAVLDLDGPAAERAASGLGGEAIGFEADVSRSDDLGAAVKGVLDRFGRIDILAANAGIYPSMELADITDARFAEVTGVNVLGAIHSIQACVPVMREHRYGRVVLTSSITGPLVGAIGYALYGSTKAAMLGLMRGFALELAGDGITINAVQPGNVRTGGFEQLEEDYKRQMVESIPMRRLAEPEEVGWAVRFLASEEAAYITGQTIVIDGGQVLPEGSA
jgi:3-oxoacyl-[acyl-carrier protein] reductase